MSEPKTYRIRIEPLRWEASDPVSAEHELVSRLVSETLKSGWQCYTELDLNLIDAGKGILKAGPETSARIVLALVAHAAHFDDLSRQARALAQNEMERINWHSFCPEWEAIWPARQVSAQALRRVMRRKLPLGCEHLLKLADWITSAEWQSDSLYPLKAFVKAVEAYGDIDANDTALRSSLSRVARLFRNSHSKDLPKLAHQIETTLGVGTDIPASAPDQRQSAGPDPSQPAPLGSPHVLVQLKQSLGILPEDNTANVEVGFDHFPLRSDSPLREEHELINMLLPEVVERTSYHNPVLSLTEAGRAMLNRDAHARGKVLLAAAERCVNTHFVPGGGLQDHRCWQSQYAVQGVLGSLLRTEPKLDRNGLFDLLLFLSALSGHHWTAHAECIPTLIVQVEQVTSESPLTDGERHVLHRLRCQSVRTCPFGHPAPEVTRLNQLLRDGLFMALVPGEAWSDAVNLDVGSLAQAVREKWVELLQHAASATGSRPSLKWLKTAKEMLKKLGTEQIQETLQRWLPLVNAPRTVRLLGGGLMSRADMSGTIHDDNATCLRGLLWMTPEVVSPDLIRAIGALTVSCYRKIPGGGQRRGLCLESDQRPARCRATGLAEGEGEVWIGAKGNRKGLQCRRGTVRIAAPRIGGNVCSLLRIN